MNLSSDLSLWWTLPLLGLSFLAAWFLYQKSDWIAEIGSRKRIFLISLRGLVLFFSFLLLLNLIFDFKSFRDEKPLALFVLDNSSSMNIHDKLNQLPSEVTTYQRKLSEELSVKFDVVFEPLHDQGDIVKFNGATTNFSNHLQNLRNRYLKRNIGAVVILSDGNYNQGNNPIYSADQYNFVPFYSIGYGDTTQKKDLALKDVLVNDYAFYKNEFPIQVELETKKSKGDKVVVELILDGKKVDERVIRPTTDYSYHQIDFVQIANQVGIQKITVKVRSIAGEAQTRNNSETVYVDVLDSRNKIILLAEAPHPDISAIKSTLSAAENLTVESYLISEWDKKLDKVDLVIWHEPGLTNFSSVQQLLVKNRIPILYLIGPQSNNSNIQNLNLGLKIPIGLQTDRIDASVNTEFKAFSLSDETVSFFDKLPPLVTKFGSFTVPTNSQILLFQKLGPIVKKEPLQYFFEKNGVKNSAILAEGIWVWRMTDYLKNQSFLHFDEWLNKTCQYLIVKENRSPFVVRTEKRYSKSSDITLTAEVYDGSYELDNSEDVNFTLINEENKSRKLVFAKNNKAYRLSLGRLVPGSYSWKATVKRNGKLMSEQGYFIVEDERLEDLDIEANFGALRQISNQTGGEFLDYKNRNNLFKILNEREDLTTVRYEESSFQELIDLKWFFFLIFVLISVEWFLRKWWGSY